MQLVAFRRLARLQPQAKRRHNPTPTPLQRQRQSRTPTPDSSADNRSHLRVQASTLAWSAVAPPHPTTNTAAHDCYGTNQRVYTHIPTTLRERNYSHGVKLSANPFTTALSTGLYSAGVEVVRRSNSSVFQSPLAKSLTSKSAGELFTRRGSIVRA